MARVQVLKVITASPPVLGYSVEKNLKPKVKWLSELGMAQAQIIKVIVVFPRIFGCSIEQNLRPKVEWFFQLGMTQGQIAKLTAAFPPVLGYSVELNLQPKVKWLSDLGMTRNQVVKVIAVFPQILSLSIERNLLPKLALLQEVLGAHGVLDAVLKGPQIMGLSFLRLSTRLTNLVKRNETVKLVPAMMMTRESFQSRFLVDLGNLTVSNAWLECSVKKSRGWQREVFFCLGFNQKKY